LSSPNGKTKGVPPFVDLLAVVFENDPASLVGVQLLLDMVRFRDRMAARRQTLFCTKCEQILKEK
jgi:hypothetical protein